jgi:uridine kinase
MIIGIGGASTAGKNTLAFQLCAFLQSSGISCTVVDQDDYVLPEEEIPKILGHTDWEVPESIDFEAFRTAILEEYGRSDIVIVVGLMVYYHPEIDALFDRRIYLDISFETMLRRKGEDTRWSGEPDPEWYVKHIWRSHQKYGKPQAVSQCMYVSGELKIDLHLLLEKLQISV